MNKIQRTPSILTGAEIEEIIKDWRSREIPRFERLSAYVEGRNPHIMERVVPVDVPNNVVPVSYGRKMVYLVTSYMFKPGNITYDKILDKSEILEATPSSTDPLEGLKKIFSINDEQNKTMRMGEEVSTYGVGYELLWYEGKGPVHTMAGPGLKENVPHFDTLSVEQTIPLYDFGIVPRLWAFILYGAIPDQGQEYAQVYYEKDKEAWARKMGGKGFTREVSGPHGFNQVPLVVYENNRNLIGDFEPVIPLIDSYDVVVSDSLNEMDRSAWAYLIMKGVSLSPEDAEMTKFRRAFTNLDSTAEVSFLTKDLNSDYLQLMLETIRGEIHRQSGIPNIDDVKMGGPASGKTLELWIDQMEYFTDVKQPYFERGLRRRIELIMETPGMGITSEDVKIIWNRNKPDNSMRQAEIFEKYSGHLSEETLMANYADCVDDVQVEMARLEKEKQGNMAAFDLDNIEDEEEKREEENEEEQRDGEEEL